MDKGKHKNGPPTAIPMMTSSGNPPLADAHAEEDEGVTPMRTERVVLVREAVGVPALHTSQTS
jgi:hypothetical protein